MSAHPYIGVTGLSSPGEVQKLTGPLVDQCDAITQLLPGGRQLMVGALVSSKTLTGQKNRWPRRYPKIGDVNSIMKTAAEVAGHLTFRVIHYNTDDPSTIFEQLMRLTEYVDEELLCGIQLNMAWPDPDDLWCYHCQKPNVRIILQIGARAMSGLADYEIAFRILHDYRSTISEVLIDPSGGQGIQVEYSEYAHLLGLIQEWTPKINIGIAGGLASDNCHELAPLFRQFPNMSIDAEGRLRDAEDNLLVADALHYIESAIVAINAAQ